MRRSTLFASVAGAAVATALAGGLGWAATGGELQGCVTIKSGDLRLVDSASACKASERSVSWNQQGPQGPSGPQGAEGPSGPSGPPGPAGKDATSHWAVVVNAHATPSFKAATGVSAVQRRSQGEWDVTFETDVSSCALTATQVTGWPASVMVGWADTNVARVRAYLSDASLVDIGAFSIAAFC